MVFVNSCEIMLPPHTVMCGWSLKNMAICWEVFFLKKQQSAGKSS